MTYKALADEIQRYLNQNAWIKGYISEQEIRASKPCHDAIEKTGLGTELTLEKSQAAGRFYDIYADIRGCRIRIGSMENDGTIKKQTVCARFIDINRYGELDVTLAFLCMARDRLTERLSTQLAEINSMKRKMEQLYEKVARTDKILQEIRDYIPESVIQETKPSVLEKKPKKKGRTV